MKTKLTLMAKLVTTSVGLVVIAVALLGLISLWDIRSFARDVSKTSADALQEDGIAALAVGSRSDRETIQSFIETLHNDCVRLAMSGAMANYVSALSGQNEMWNKAAEQESVRILQGIERTCKTQQALLQESLRHNMAVASKVLQAAGGLSEAAETVTWDAVSQGTQEKTSISLPKLQIGAFALERNASFDHPSPVVDETSNLVGGACTIFQRMNEKGDMLRVATNVKAKDGQRAIGTYIPLLNEDGTTNPVISAVLKGDVYEGRTFVVDAWYITSYKPLQDAAGKVIGMLFAGVKEQSNDELLAAVAGTKIGELGYVFVMDSKGNLQVHPNAALLGKNVISDLGLEPFRNALADRSSERIGLLNYEFKGKRKFAAYTYFKEWDWIICASGQWDEMSQQAAAKMKTALTTDMQQLYQTAKLNTTNGMLAIYNQIRYLDESGREIIYLKDGTPQAELGSRSNAVWFKEALAAKSGEVTISAVENSKNTGRPEVRICSPVISGQACHGVVVLNADWQLTRSLLGSRVYGRTGYPYIINSSGVLITHPKYTLTEQVNLTDAKYGALADIVRNKMCRGEEGSDRYSFEGVDKFVAYSPFKMGDLTYEIAATCPVEELLDTARSIEARSRAQLKSAATVLAVSAMGFAVIGWVIGFLVSRSIALPLKRLVEGMTAASDQTASASGQVSGASQSLAQGASQQASSLEETSSALEQMASMTRQSADNANQANAMAKDANNTALEGVDSMKRMSEAIEKIKNSSSETAKIIKTIDEIAFQTNLLALNAAVEAARAGEAGKGFAVVAEEVRNLARRSAEAAKNTAALIEGATKNAEAGVAVTGEVAKNLQKIQEVAAKVATLIAEITAASKEQSQGIDQVNTAVSEMDKVVQQNAASAEESASAAEELSSQAQELASMVGQLTSIVGGVAANGNGHGSDKQLPPARREPMKLAAHRPTTARTLPSTPRRALASRAAPRQATADHAFMPWTADLSIGIDTIDEQHKRLVSWINRLHHAENTGEVRDQITALLDGLMDCTRTHFAQEEEMMAKASYPALSEHRAAHAIFVKKISEARSGLGNGQLAVGSETLGFLKSWLARHIQDADRKYAPQVKKCGAV